MMPNPGSLLMPPGFQKSLGQGAADLVLDAELNVRKCFLSAERAIWGCWAVQRQNAELARTQSFK